MPLPFLLKEKDLVVAVRLRDVWWTVMQIGAVGMYIRFIWPLLLRLVFWLVVEGGVVLVRCKSERVCLWE